jgi:hypothetical protein
MRGVAPSVTALTTRSSGTQCQATPAPAPLSSNVMRQCRCPEVRSYLSREVLSNIEEFF